VYFNDEIMYLNSGRRSIVIRNSDLVKSNGQKSMSMNDFTIIDMLGSGSYGSVYTVTKNGEEILFGK